MDIRLLKYFCTIAKENVFNRTNGERFYTSKINII